MEKTRMTDKEYVRQCGAICPSCRSSQIDGGHIEVDGSSAWQEITCFECGATWTDVYELVGYENLEVCNEK